MVGPPEMRGAAQWLAARGWRRNLGGPAFLLRSDPVAWIALPSIERYQLCQQRLEAAWPDWLLPRQGAGQQRGSGAALYRLRRL